MNNGIKETLKQVKESLKGLTLQLRTPNSVRPYSTLAEFGKAFLAEEAKGHTIRVSQVWTSEGIVRVNSTESLIGALRTKKVSAIQFVSNDPNERINWGD